MVLLAGCLILSACGRVPAAPGEAPAVATGLIQQTATPPPSRTPLPPPTRRSPPPTALPSATPIPSLTPIPPLHDYVFPIQPPEAATFAEGVQGHGYPATDLFARVGTKFVAVTDGMVEFISATDDWNPNRNDPAERSGLAVAILGDDGLRYYGSHLSGLAPGLYYGLRVKPGDLLGFVGASGDARGKDAHLHFGISHPTTPDDWKTRRGEIDPYPYLLAWKNGHNWTPQFPTPTP